MLGGWFVDAGSWRVAFATIVPVALLTLAVAARRVPNPPVMRRAAAVDWLGCRFGDRRLFGVVSGIIALGSSPMSMFALVAGTAALIAFVLHERRTASPDDPARPVRVPQLRGRQPAHVAAVLGVTGAFFVLAVQPGPGAALLSTATGAAFLPFALLVGLLVATRRRARRSDRRAAAPGGRADDHRARTAPASRCRASAGPYWATFLAPMLLTGFGMALTVAPLTTSGPRLRSTPAEAGIASGVNNTVARMGTVLAVAVVGVVAVALYGSALEHRLAARRRS